MNTNLNILQNYPALKWCCALAVMCVLAWLPVTAAAEQPAAASQPSLGPVIKQFGPVYETADAYGLKQGVEYRAVMDVTDAPDDPSQLNRAIESAARFLNMHARAGVPRDKLQLAVVLHGSAGKHALASPFYQARFDVANPNDALLTALSDAGVDIYLCGQTAGSRGYPAAELHPAVTMATSAMTVLTRLQAEGWSLLP